MRGTAGGSLTNRCVAAPSRMGVIFPPEPPVASALAAERPGAVKGAPGFGAAKRTLDGEDRSGLRPQTTGGLGGKITFPAGELRAFFFATFSASDFVVVGLRTSNGLPDLSTANRYATNFRATASVARLRLPRFTSRSWISATCWFHP